MLTKLLVVQLYLAERWIAKNPPASVSECVYPKSRISENEEDPQTKDMNYQLHGLSDTTLLS